MMRCICGECGREIPDGMDFCPYCGCLRSKACCIDDSGRSCAVCPECGHPIAPGDQFCGSCGAHLDHGATPVRMIPRMKKNGNLAIMLALLPGFFNIFGLGHLVMKQYSRGLMFLGISLVLWYLNGWSFTNTSLLLTVLDICVFFYQCMDLFRYVYTVGGD